MRGREGGRQWGEREGEVMGEKEGEVMGEKEGEVMGESIQRKIVIIERDSQKVINQSIGSLTSRDVPNTGQVWTNR